MTICVEAALMGQRWIWGAPTYGQTRIGFNETRKAAGNFARFNLSRQEVEFPTGGMILFRSLDDPDNARGDTADGVVMDEVADIKQEAWFEILRPMLLDTGGQMFAGGTPKGRNWFWQEWMKALDNGESMCWQAPTLGVEIQNGRLVRVPHALENPDIGFAEIESLYQTMPERAFRQEILAEFLEDSAVFRKIREAATAKPQGYAQDGHPSHPKHTYVVGIDWGKYEDYSVFAVVDTTIGELCHLDRSNRIDYTAQIKRLEDLCKRFQVTEVIAESNAQETTIELMRKANLPVREFVTSNTSKQNIIEGLMLGLEQSKLKILDDPVLLGELQAFEATRLPGGGIRYAAPQGMHDDCVMAVAFAWDGAKDSTPMRIVRPTRR